VWELVRSAVSSALGMVCRVRVRHWQHTPVVANILLLGGKSAAVVRKTVAVVGKESQPDVLIVV
jgi:hypothetical protein